MLIAETLSALGLKAFSPVPHQTTGGSVMSWLLPGERSPAKKIGDGGNTSIVGAVLNWYYRNFPEAEFRVTNEDAQGLRTPVIPHELTDLIDTPNLYYDGDALWAGLLYSFILDGNGYWLKARNDSTRVIELWWAPHTLVEPKGDDRGEVFITHYEYRVAGKVFKIDPRDIVHVRFGIDPLNPRKGISQLKQQLRELLTDEEAARFSAALVQNVGIPGVIVSPSDPAAEISVESAVAAKAKYEQDFGLDNRGRAMFMTGASKVERLGFSPQELTLDLLRRVPEERVSAALGVPAAVVGLGTGLAQTKVGATMHELREMAVESALVPIWRTFARQTERSLLPEFNAGDRTQKMEFDTSNVRVLQEDRQRLHERTRADVDASIVDVATAQARLGYPVDDTQRVYLRSPLMVEIPAAEPPTPRQRRERLKASRNGKGPQLTAAQQAGLAYVRYVERAQRPLTDAFTTRLIGAFEALGARAADVYEAAPKADPADEDLVELILGSLAVEDFAAITTTPMYGAYYESTARLSYAGMERTLGIGLSIGTQDTVAERVLREGGRRAGLLELNGQTREALFEALEQARAEGLGVPATGRRIRQLVPSGPYPAAGVRYRAELIARTENLFARNLSTAETGRAAGFERYVAFDNRVGFNDAECAARDGQEFTYDEMTVEDDHPNGTLSFSPIPASQAAPAGAVL